LEFIAGGAKNFRGQVRGGFYAGDRGILGNITNLIHLDAGFTRKSGFKLVRKGRRFCVAAGKSANKTGELWLRECWRKVDAGDTGSDQQLREIFFARGGPEWDTIEQNLISGSAE
jgi:hypothetical protein